MNIEQSFINNVNDIEATLSFWKDKIIALKANGSSELSSSDTSYLSKISKLETTDGAVGRLLFMKLFSGLVPQLLQYPTAYVDLNKGEVPDLSYTNPETEMPSPFILSNSAVAVDIELLATELLDPNKYFNLFVFTTPEDYLENSAPITLRITGDVNGVQPTFTTSNGESTTVTLTANSQQTVIFIFKDEAGKPVFAIYEGLFKRDNPYFPSKEDKTYSGTLTHSSAFHLTNYGAINVINDFGGYTSFATPSENNTDLSMAGIFKQNVSNVNTSGVTDTGVGEYNKQGYKVPIAGTSAININLETANIALAGDVITATTLRQDGVTANQVTITGLTGFNVTWLRIVHFDTSASGFIVIAFKALKAGESFYSMVSIPLDTTISVTDILEVNKVLISDSCYGFYVHSLDIKKIRSQNLANAAMIELTYDVAAETIAKITDGINSTDPRSELEGTIEVEVIADNVRKDPPAIHLVKPIASVIGSRDYIRDDNVSPRHLGLTVETGSNIKMVVAGNAPGAYVKYNGNDITIGKLSKYGSSSGSTLVGVISDVHLEADYDNVYASVLSEKDIYNLSLSSNNRVQFDNRLEGSSAVGLLREHRVIGPNSEGDVLYYDSQGAITSRNLASFTSEPEVAIYEYYYNGDSR